MADLFGDELAFRAEIATIDSAHTSQVVGLVIQHIRQSNEGTSLFSLARSIAQGLSTSQQVMKDAFAGFCEVAQRLAERFGFSESILIALGQVFERWDGRGDPPKLKGEDIALSMRIVTLAQDAVTFIASKVLRQQSRWPRNVKGRCMIPHGGVLLQAGISPARGARG